MALCRLLGVLLVAFDSGYFCLCMFIHFGRPAVFWCLVFLVYLVVQAEVLSQLPAKRRQAIYLQVSKKEVAHCSSVSDPQCAGSVHPAPSMSNSSSHGAGSVMTSKGFYAWACLRGMVCGAALIAYSSSFAMALLDTWPYDIGQHLREDRSLDGIQRALTAVWI